MAKIDLDRTDVQNLRTAIDAARQRFLLQGRTVEQLHRLLDEAEADRAVAWPRVPSGPTIKGPHSPA